VNFSDPALWVALLVGVLLVVVWTRLQPPPAPEPRCLDCDLILERQEEIVDPENPERRFIPGEREAYFRCPRCGQRRRARY